AGTLRPMGRYLDLFCMGAAFLLLETKNVVQFALLFGTTWFVNSLVFVGILLAVYLAIEVARRVDLGPSWRLYLALLVALVVAWLVQPELLLTLAVVPRFVVAIVLAFAPVFFAYRCFALCFPHLLAGGCSPLRRCDRACFRPCLFGQPRVCKALPRCLRLEPRVRGQPPGGHGWRSARVRVAADRLSGAAGPDCRALRRCVRAP